MSTSLSTYEQHGNRDIVVLAFGASTAAETNLINFRVAISNLANFACVLVLLFQHTISRSCSVAQ